MGSNPLPSVLITSAKIPMEKYGPPSEAPWYTNGSCNESVFSCSVPLSLAWLSEVWGRINNKSIINQCSLIFNFFACLRPMTS